VIRFVSVQVFPFPLRRLWAACATPDYPLRKYEALGAEAVRIHRFEADEDSIEVDLVRDVPVDPRRLPAWSRRWAPSRQQLQQRTSWRRTSPDHADATLSIRLGRLPVHAHATGSLDEAGGRTVMKLQWQVRATVPGLGAALERLMQGQLELALQEDRQFTLGYVAGLQQ
jgi:hypothetical protein